MRAIGLAAMVMLAGTAPLRAEPQQVECRMRVVLGGKELVAATSASNAVSRISIGQAATVRLMNTGQMRFVIPLDKPAAMGDRGGLLALHVVTAGTYRVAVGGKAWIDVARAGLPVASTGHAHGAACSGIAKMVDFALDPGDYIVQFSDTADETIGVQVTKQP